MRQTLNENAFTVVVKPGEIYVFTEDENTLVGIEGPAISYTIRSDEDLEMALEMEVSWILREMFDFVEFIEWERLSDDCCCFRFLYKPDEFAKMKFYSIYLHRMLSVAERFELVKLDFADDDDPEGDG